MKRLVLVGGGHAHLSVLRAMAQRRPKDVELTLIKPSAHQNYSDMLPGWISGHHARTECGVDLRPLAEAAGAEWGNPQDALYQVQFWKVFEIYLENLPGKQGRVFMMKEFVELVANEISTEVNITVSNLNVMLHRARLRLRECLENRWFTQEIQAC